VTDATLLLGYLSSDSALAGGLKLDRDAAEHALERLGAPLGMTALEAAAGVVEIANLEMLRATTAATVARGIDPRDHVLIAFGGAGPMHAPAIAEALEITRVICPAACGVLSAWGISVAGRRRDRSRSLVRLIDEVGADELAAIEAELSDSAAEELNLAAGEFDSEAVYELRYAGQAFELPVAAEYADLARGFHDAHEERFGFAEREAAIELVTVRVSVTAMTTAAEDSEPEPHSAHTGESITGPAVIEQPHATIVVPPGWTASYAGEDVVLDRDPEGAAR
jgi:N-methylhydantoinase A/oxoprolinase/acetone carboxylase beta subunit